MEEGRIEFARSAWNKFLRFFPSPHDKQCLKDELLRRRAEPDAGTRVPFGQWDGCYVTWAEKWRIIYQKGNPGGIYVVDIDKIG